MMKYLLTFFALMLVGVGCINIFKNNEPLEGEWTLGFDLPEDWVMMRAYSEAGGKADATLDIKGMDPEVILQSTPEHIFTIAEDRRPTDLEKYGNYVTENYIKISVTRVDPNRIIAFDEMEDLKKGFYKESDSVYYLDLNDVIYKFDVKREGRNAAEAQRVILSAKRTVAIED